MGGGGRGGGEGEGDEEVGKQWKNDVRSEERILTFLFSRIVVVRSEGGRSEETRVVLS